MPIERGFCLYAHCTPEDVKDAVATGATLFRYQILPEPWLASTLPLSGWKVWIEAYINHIETIILPNLGRARVLLDMHSSPGGIARGRTVCLRDMAAREVFYRNWETLAKRFADVPGVLGYCVLNEPLGPWRQINGLMADTHAMLSKINPEKIICITGAKGTARHIRHVPRTSTANTWVEVHVYDPMKFTHQGLWGYRKGRRYPTRGFGKKHLRKKLEPLVRLRNEGYQGFIGEFSASIFADLQSRRNYIRDCVELFTEFNWPYCFHAWREAGVWTPEPDLMDLLG